MSSRRSTSLRRVLAGLTAAAAATLSTPSRAQKMPTQKAAAQDERAAQDDSARQTIVIEFHQGERPEDAGQHLGPVLDALREHGVRTDVRQAYEARISRPGVEVDPATLADFPARADEGYRAWTDERFADAIHLLGRAVETAERARAAMLTEEMRGAYRLALVGLTLAHKRLGHTRQAMETMAELVRNFPDMPLHRSEFGSEAASLYDRTKSSLTELGLGRLSVSVDDPDAIVLLNGQYRSTPDELKNLVPGPYWVVARKRKTTGRIYRLVVEAGKTASVRIAWSLDSVIHTSATWAGFLFPDTASAGHLAHHATELGRLLGAATVIALSIGNVDGRRSVIGKVFMVGKPGPRSTASVAIEPVGAPLPYLSQLGAYLAGATDLPPPRQPAATDLTVTPSHETEPAGRFGLRRPLAWGALTGGALAVGTGIVFLRIDGRDTCDTMGGTLTCPHVYRSATWGYGLVTAGSVAILGSAYLLWRWRRPRSPAISIHLGPAPGIALATEF